MNSYEFLFDGETVESTVESSGDLFTVSVGDKRFEFQKIGDSQFSCTVNGRRMTVAVVKKNSTCYIDIDSLQLELSEPSQDQFSGAGDSHAGDKDKIFAPMPGKIVKIMVEVGQEIKERQPMVVVEAMKMENQVNAKAAGTVKAINFNVGDQVDTESAIIELELGE